jgi:ankyrin repeat protein
MVRAKLAGPFAQVLSDMRHDSKALQQHLSQLGLTDPEKIREHTTTMLMHAVCLDSAFKKPESVVKQLIQADPNMVQDGTGATALMLTTSAETASCLLDNGADVNKQTEETLTVLHYAVEGPLALVKVLLKPGAQEQILRRRKTGETPFSMAVYCGEVEVALLMLEQLLLRPGFDINHPRLGANQPLLCAAAKVGMLRVVEVGLNHGADANATGPDGPALLLAIQYEHSNVVSLLCERGAAVQMRWGIQDSLSVAILLGNVPIIKKLISYGADVNEVHGGVPVLLHALFSDPAVVTLLLKAGVSFNAKLQFDCLALASEKLDDAAAVKMVKALLPHCSDLNAVDAVNGTTVLAYAVKHGKLQTARALHAAGADLWFVWGNHNMRPSQLSTVTYH